MIRRRLLLFAVVLASLIGVGIYLLLPPKPGVTLENFRRLHVGMTRSEVESILGTPDEQESTKLVPKYIHWSSNGFFAEILFENPVRVLGEGDGEPLASLGFLSVLPESDRSLPIRRPVPFEYLQDKPATDFERFCRWVKDRTGF